MATVIGFLLRFINVTLLTYIITQWTVYQYVF